MVIIKPSTLLVCLAILSCCICAPSVWAFDATTSPAVLGIQGDALSAEPARISPSPSQQKTKLRTGHSERQYSSSPIRHRNSYERPRTSARTDPIEVSVLRNGPRKGPVCLTPACPPPGPPVCGVAPVPFNPAFDLWLPQIGPKRVELSAKLWYSTLHNSQIVWGSNPFAGRGTELDLVQTLGLNKRNFVGEYEARCQIQCNWGLRYSFMPIDLRENHIPNEFFYFGNTLYPAGLSTLTTWRRNIHRWDLVYSWFKAPHAVSEIFGGYALYDDKLTVSNIIQSRSRSSNFGVAFAGMSIQRAAFRLGPAAVSLNCKWSAQFLDDYFGWDGYGAGRISMPFDCGRFAYVEAGWRWIVLKRDYPTNKDETNMEGLIGAVGLVF